MTKEDFQEMSGTIPREPGVYQFIDGDGDILYVGKAKSLRNRLSSYFNTGLERYRTKVMVKHAKEIRYTVVETESDAYLLENSLIKKFQPRYNVDWKDGKSYTYLCIKNEPFPRVFFTRKLIRDGSDYFGPYTSKARTKILLDLIRDLFPLRTCNLDLSEHAIQSKGYKVCLEYHIDNCLGPCVSEETSEEYLTRIEQIKNILKGNFKAVRDHLHGQMETAASELNFEKAERWKNKLVAFEDYQGKSTVASIKIRDLDVFSCIVEKNRAFVNYIKVANGAIIRTYIAEMKTNLDENEQEILQYVIPRIRSKFSSESREVVVEEKIEIEEEVDVTVPKIGDKKKLLDLCQKNLQLYVFNWRREQINKKTNDPVERILTTLQNDLNMNELPVHIECFDNSNIQGALPVASCVVFRNAKPYKKDYRHYNIKTVVGPNDFASMEEVVHRRYSRLLREGDNLPQLIVIDGGKGQLSSAMKSIYLLGIEKQVTVIGIAKKLEEIYFPGDSIPLYINKASESLKLIQRVRNEAHRFAITFHRQKRKKTISTSELESIDQVGRKTAQKLIRQFKSIKRIREATLQQLIEVVGPNKAKTIKKYFARQQKS